MVLQKIDIIVKSSEYLSNFDRNVKILNDQLCK